MRHFIVSTTAKNTAIGVLSRTDALPVIGLSVEPGNVVFPAPLQYLLVDVDVEPDGLVRLRRCPLTAHLCRATKILTEQPCLAATPFPEIRVDKVKVNIHGL